jgi:hypothetical protein
MNVVSDAIILITELSFVYSSKGKLAHYAGHRIIEWLPIVFGEPATHIVPSAGEVYKISFPAYYVRGILIGVMRMEIR